MPSYDNRESCTNVLPSGCLPYTGYVSPTIFTEAPCRPNVNDILKKLQEVIDDVRANLGDNSTLNITCIEFIPTEQTQKDLNQALHDELCALKTTVEGLGGAIDPTTIMLAVDLLCLQDPSCDPQPTYNLVFVINKILTAICNLETRVTNIETLLNI